jgi:hypothetical protein
LPLDPLIISCLLRQTWHWDLLEDPRINVLECFHVIARRAPKQQREGGKLGLGSSPHEECGLISEDKEETRQGFRNAPSFATLK